jgi:hypothetical protein
VAPKPNPDQFVLDVLGPIQGPPKPSVYTPQPRYPYHGPTCSWAVLGPASSFFGSLAAVAFGSASIPRIGCFLVAGGVFVLFVPIRQTLRRRAGREASGWTRTTTSQRNAFRIQWSIIIGLSLLASALIGTGSEMLRRSWLAHITTQQEIQDDLRLRQWEKGTVTRPTPRN